MTQVLKARRMKWARHVTSMGERRNAYTVLVEEPDDSAALGSIWYMKEDEV
jgi:hypothetical protein